MAAASEAVVEHFESKLLGPNKNCPATPSRSVPVNEARFRASGPARSCECTRSREQGAWSREQGAWSREQGAGGSRGEQGAGSREQGAGSREQGARSREQGAGTRRRAQHDHCLGRQTTSKSKPWEGESTAPAHTSHTRPGPTDVQSASTVHGVRFESAFARPPAARASPSLGSWNGDVLPTMDAATYQGQE